MPRERLKRVKLNRKRKNTKWRYVKGGDFEREVCKKWSLWMTHSKMTDVFWRTAMSGGRATVMGRRGVEIRQSGDMQATAPEGFPWTDRYFSEMKSRNDLNFVAFLLKGQGNLAKFWKKAIAEARKYKRLPIMICGRIRGLPNIIITRHPVSCYMLRSELNDCYISHLDEFLRTQRPPEPVINKLHDPITSTSKLDAIDGGAIVDERFERVVEGIEDTDG